MQGRIAVGVLEHSAALDAIWVWLSVKMVAHGEMYAPFDTEVEAVGQFVFHSEANGEVGSVNANRSQFHLLVLYFWSGHQFVDVPIYFYSYGRKTLKRI